MAFYDFFANFYDASLEKLQLEPGMSVIDLPCGTGQSFAALTRGIGPDGRLIGLDLSAGMLRRAKERCEREGYQNVHLAACDVQTLDRQTLAAAVGDIPRIDRLHVFLGMSVFPDMERAFTQLWSLLAPGGRCVLVDVHAERLGLQGHAVNLLARADIRRRFWEPLERNAARFERRDLPYRKEHGGQIMLAVGDKAPAPADA